MSSGSPAPREHHSARLTNGSQRPARAGGCISLPRSRDRGQGRGGKGRGRTESTG